MQIARASFRVAPALFHLFPEVFLFFIITDSKEGCIRWGCSWNFCFIIRLEEKKNQYLLNMWAFFKVAVYHKKPNTKAGSGERKLSPLLLVEFLCILFCFILSLHAYKYRRHNLSKERHSVALALCIYTARGVNKTTRSKWWRESFVTHSALAS